MIRITAWSRRIARYGNTKRGPLEPQEQIKAQFKLIREAQRHFKEERKLIMENKDIPKKSELYKVSPCIDTADPEKLIRMKGRLMRSKHLAYSTRVPIILPCNNLIRIVEFYHAVHVHQDIQAVLNDIRQRFVIHRIRS